MENKKDINLLNGCSWFVVPVSHNVNIMEDIDPSGQQIVPENKLAHLSIDSVVEAVLNNGNERLS